MGRTKADTSERAADYYNKKLLRITYIGSAVWNLRIMILTPFVRMDFGVIGICLAMVGDCLVKAALILVSYHSRKWTKFQVID